MSTAVLVIDVQNALCFGEYAAFESERVIDRINVVTSKARKAGAAVFLIQHESADGPLRRDTKGWDLARGLVAAKTDIVVHKTTPDAFHNTALLSELHKRGADRLVICGFQSDFCVDTTTRRALALGYPVTLVADGHSTLGNGILEAAQISAHHAATLSNLTSFGPTVSLQPAGQIEI